MLWVIPMIQQDCNFGNVHGFQAEVIHVVGQHLNQSRIVGDIRSGAVREEGKSQRIHRQMPFDPIRRFVEAKPLRVHTGIARILHRLRVNDDQRCPLGFFLPVRVLARVRQPAVAQSPPLPATVCSANRRSSSAAGLWASPPNCTHS